MKSTKDFRAHDHGHDADDLRRGTKLPPLKKSGKERHSIYGGLDDDEDDEIISSSSKRESVYDYFDDEDDL